MSIKRNRKIQKTSTALDIRITASMIGVEALALMAWNPQRISPILTLLKRSLATPKLPEKWVRMPPGWTQQTKDRCLGGNCKWLTLPDKQLRNRSASGCIGMEHGPPRHCR